MYSISESILSYLLWSDDYLRRVIIHLKEDYYETPEEKKIFSLIREHFGNFNQAPSKEELFLELQEDTNLSSLVLDACEKLIIKMLECPCSTFSFDNMFSKAEDFAKDRSLFLALADSIRISQEDDNKLSKTAIPQLMSDALSVSFDTTIGHDYFSDYKSRYEFYNSDEEKVEFDLNILNRATEGGVPRQTLNIIYAGVNVGKSLCLCHLAASYLSQGLNVLFVSMEMSEKITAQRIDANLFNHNINKLGELSDVDYEKKLFKAKNAAKNGRLFIKHYPSISVSSHHIDNLIEELRIKKDSFIPDVIIVDYIGILGSSRLSLGKGGVNTNTYWKFVSEELRGLGVKHDAIVWTAQQFNRGGYSSSDPDLDDAAESFGVTATADFVLSLTTNPELAELGQYFVKVLKTRYSKKVSYSNFQMGVDYDYMKLFDLPESMSMSTKDKIKQREKYDIPTFNKGTKDAKKIDFN